MEPGTRLGPYTIREPIGEGGMGAVYAGEDGRLGRKVAIKVLPPDFASDPERLARFEQEARAAAALNHPHIAVVHDIGVEDGVHYMVQEYLEGQSLHAELEGGPLSVRRALALGAEIAAALNAAHAAGIVHRDLKPANIFVSPEGHAKILDFGLAKLTEGGAALRSDSAESPTMLGTIAGQVMGTAGYMAPEQVQGGEVDGRADLFAFGCVLYEMVAGRQPFAGRSMLQTLDRIIHEDPDAIDQADARVPAQLRWILDKCLAKELARRYQGASDLAVDLRRLAADVDAGRAGPVASSEPGSGSAAATAAPGLSPGLAGGAVVVTAILAALLGAWLMQGEPSPARPATRFSVSLPDGLAFTSTGRRAVTISPDGRTIAFTGNDQIYLRRLGDPEMVPVRGTTGAPDSGGRSPAFSPDGQSLVFWVDGQLKRVAVVGGLPVALTLADNPQGLRWEADDTIWYGQFEAGIWRVPAAGGTAELVVEVAEGQEVHGPQLLPGGEWLLYTLAEDTRRWDESRVVARSLQTGEVRELVARGRDARYVATGHLVYGLGTDLLAVPFDATRLETTGPAVVVSDRVRGARNLTAVIQYAVSDTGTLVTIPGAGISDSLETLAWFDRDGNVELLPFEPRALERLALSPDGSLAAVEERDEDGLGLWIWDLQRGSRQLLMAEDRGAWFPVWSATGERLFVSGDDGVYSVPPDRSAPPTLLETTGERPATIPWSTDRDGNRLAAMHPGGSNLTYLQVLELPALGTPIDEISGGVFNWAASLSPDGRYLAYQSGRSGTLEVYVRDTETGATVTASVGGGEYPRWSPAGDELFYLDTGETRNPILVSVAVEDGMRLSAPERLFAVPVTERAWAVSPDASRFLFIALPEETRTGQRDRVDVVIDWFSELRERVPAGS